MKQSASKLMIVSLYLFNCGGFHGGGHIVYPSLVKAAVCRVYF